VGVFVADDGEPDLSRFVHDVWSSQGETGSLLQVALPVLSDDPNDFSMTYVAWTANDRLVPARFGIPVPATRQPIEPDLILAPFTGFDPAGNRIGRGGGFFDRFLASTTARVVGVGFECQRFAAIPVEPHDVPLKTIVTDLGVRYLT
jgi:5-formyltetrahydrofolate cyclo-ligase